jgi:hypothetical protein
VVGLVYTVGATPMMLSCEAVGGRRTLEPGRPLAEFEEIRGRVERKSYNMDKHAALIRAVIGPLWATWERSPYLRHYRRLKGNEFNRL